MDSYLQLLALLAPIFILIGVGVIVRRVGWLTHEADATLLRLVVNLFYPCLIFESVLGNPALRTPGNLVWAPAVGFVTMALGFLTAWWAGKIFGLRVGTGLRTFAFAVGIYNYSYIPIPLVTSLFGRETLGVLLVHNVGCEAAIWTVGIFVLAGLSLRKDWRKLISAPVVSLALALVANALRLTDRLPGFVFAAIHSLAICAIPVGLLTIGATLEEYLAEPQQLFHPRITGGACLLRLGVLPLAFLGLARVLPCSLALKHVMVVQASMPTGLMLLVITKRYAGQTLTAAQIIAGTTIVGLLVIPLWIKFGLRFIGG
jgi:predicted permease